jgi:Tol biopolymer transport system component
MSTRLQLILPTTLLIAGSLLIACSPISEQPAATLPDGAQWIVYVQGFTEDSGGNLLMGSVDVSEGALLDTIYDGDFGDVGPLSPDGTKLAYTEYAHPNGNNDRQINLYVINVDGSDQKLVTIMSEKLGDDICCVRPLGWSQDGKQLYVSAGTSDDPRGRKVNYTLYAVSLDGWWITKIIQVQSLSSYSAFLLSPDGEHILTVKLTGTDENTAAFIAEMDGSGLQRIPGTEQAAEASWSPDGKQVAIARNSAEGGLDLIAMNLDGSGVVTLDRDMSTFQVAWSPDGTKIAYDRHPNPGQSVDTMGLWVVNADGSGAFQLTHAQWQPNGNYGSITFFGWSPDGKWIAFEALTEEGRKVYIISASGGTPRLWIDEIGNQTFIRWLP